MEPPRTNLPIEEVLPDLRSALAGRTEAVLQAPPGAGKTTLVPLRLLNEPWMGGRKILILEPRRLATRAAAHRMAVLLGQKVGETAGYRVRGESRVGPKTRIEVVTEGILTRMIQDDPSLESVGCVIFDEFHERSLHADLGLALTLDARAAFREDLRILVMSATLDGERTAELLGAAPLVSSEGRSYPVETHYLDRTPEGRIEATMTRAISSALSESAGDLLAFLPGAGEIQRTADGLAGLGDDVDVLPLYGALGFKEQDQAIGPSLPGRRKVVLATDIAETSLTIEGVRIVIDSGLARSPLFDPASGMSRLVTRATSRASADQRRGRAGRLGPGICHRLWTRVDHAARALHAEPSIRVEDLTPLVLELAQWGVADPGRLRWLDPPDPVVVRASAELLTQLGALDAEGSINGHGRSMARLAVHPRLAHMLLKARDQGLGALGCDLAAILEERDFLRGPAHLLPVDVRLRLQALADFRDGRAPRSLLGAEIDRGGLSRCERRARELRRDLRVRVDHAPEIESAGFLLAAAYPDRIAQAVGGGQGRFRLRNGRPVEIPKSDPLAEADFLSVAATGGSGAQHRAFLAAPTTAEEIASQFAEAVQLEETILWDSPSQRAMGVARRSVGAVVLTEGPSAAPDPAGLARVLLGEVARRGLHVLPWDGATRQLQQRLCFVAAQDPRWPDRSDAGLEAGLAEWLGPFTDGMRSLADLKKLDLREALLAGADWSMRQELDRLVPTHMTVPSGSSIRLDYSDPEGPVLSVRLQEVFGLTETPTIAGVPVTIELLSPAQRPVQVTQDLAGFWEGSYFDVRKDLRGRYPKHYWPENPLEAKPTARAKPRRK